MNLDFSQYHILVIGDVMLDRYIHGDVDRISPEAPVPVITVAKRENRLGGAANVALNLKGLEAQVSILSVIGDDHAGQELANMLEVSAIEADLIIDPSRPTTCKTRVMASSQHLLRVDEESTDDLSKEVETKILTHLNKILDEKTIDLVILQDYNKGVFTSSSIAKIVSTAVNRDIKFAVDPKFNNASLFRDAFLFKPNLSEARSISNEVEVSKIAEDIKLRLKAQNVVLTLAADGMFCMSNTEEYHVKTMSKDIIDVCGAGDTVISTLSLALLHGLSLKASTELANRAAGVVCQKSGVAPILKHDLDF